MHFRPLHDRVVVEALDAAHKVGSILLPDNAQVVSAGGDNKVRVWKPAAVRVFAGHQGPVFAVAIHPNGSQVITGSSDKTVRVFDINNGNLVRGMEGHVEVAQHAADRGGRGPLARPAPLPHLAHPLQHLPDLGGVRASELVRPPGGEVGHSAIASELASLGLAQARDEPQKRGLSRPVRPRDLQQLSLPDRKTNARKHAPPAAVAGEIGRNELHGFAELHRARRSLFV